MSESSTRSTSFEQEECPERLGHYRILRRIGRGGMGIVYLAVDERLDRRVAIKVLRPAVAEDTEQRRRFEREALAVSRLEHPAIVAVHEVGEDAGVRYLVMRYVEGVPLGVFARLARQHGVSGTSPTLADAETEQRTATEVIPDGSLAVASARDNAAILHAIEKTARALHFAHENGIVHRDVKPSNIVVDRRGDPHLLDFGVARIADVETMTAAGRMLGTIPYMAPEQVTRESKADRRCDVWGLGVTLYECMTGVRPFRGESAEATMFQIVMKEPVSPRRVRPELSRDLETIIAKCLEKDPAARYATCAELADDLERLRTQRQIHARPVGAFGRLARWAARNRLAAAALAVMLSASAVTSVVLIARWSERQRLRTYHEFMQRADAAQAARRAILRRLEARRAELANLERSTPRHLAADSPEKLRLFALRDEVARLERAAEEKRAEVDYCLVRSREREATPAPDGDRARLHFDLYCDAERRGDVYGMAFHRRLLEGTPWASRLSPRGRLTLITEPAGAVARLAPARPLPGGRIHYDLAAQRELGSTPIVGVPLEAGSYLVLIEAPGRKIVRYPILIERDEHWGDPSWHDGRFARNWGPIALPVADDRLDEFVVVARGPYQATATEFDASETPALEWRWLDDFAIARRETTFDEYAAFLRTPAVQEEIRRQSERRGRLVFVPRKGDFNSMFGREDPADPTSPVTRPANGLDLDFALCGVSWNDAAAYAAWRGERDDIALRLPTASEWEKAARGVDGRRHPWGNGFDWAFTNCRHATDGDPLRLALPYFPGAFPIDTSPYGVSDMAGNAAEWCADAPVSYPDSRYLAGGAYPWFERRFFVTWPMNAYPVDDVNEAMGVRLVHPLAGEAHGPR